MCSRLHGDDARSRQAKVVSHFPSRQYFRHSLGDQNDGTLHEA